MKHEVLIITGRYLPGYKSGGILRNVINTIENLSSRCAFSVITRDRDLGDDKAYENIIVGKWHKSQAGNIFYLSGNKSPFFSLIDALSNSSPKVVFLTSFFDPLTILFLLFIRLFRKKYERVIVAPFGEFADASFRQRIFKKKLFILAAKLTKLYKGVIWRVSSVYEKDDLIRIMNPPHDSIYVVGDFPPAMMLRYDSPAGSDTLIGNDTTYKIIFLSRISREKNLDVALKILKNIASEVVFDIYGPIENNQYWDECQFIISGMPNTLKISYCGLVTPSSVGKVFAKYDLFLFPTGGEAFGNVIAESLSAGTPVLISQDTPWRNLEDDGLGWDLDISNLDLFKNKIEYLINQKSIGNPKDSIAIQRAVRIRLDDPWVLKSNMELFALDF